MEIKFCCRDGCHQVAIRAPRSSLHCRPCYVAAMLADDPALSVPVAQLPLVRCRVTGPVPITDALTATGQVTGAEVLIDPVDTNVIALVYAGHVEVLPATKAATRAR